MPYFFLVSPVSPFSYDSPVVIFDEFVKSPHDKCNYRMITLPNSLQACLISEPGLEKVKREGVSVCVLQYNRQVLL